jgi:hypothetical protein
VPPETPDTLSEACGGHAGIAAAASAIDPAYLQTKATTMDIARYPRRTCRVNSENIYP